MGKPKDLKGQHFGKLVVLEETSERKNGYIIWKCQCDCGNICFVKSDFLLRGVTQSCGCLYKERHIKNLTGNRFGRLMVLEMTEERRNGSIVWKCQCSCGNICFVSSKNLLQGCTQSCGCFFREKSSKTMSEIQYLSTKKITKHNMSQTRLYRIWLAMKRRCYNPNTKDYNNYGGRGIAVCNEWRDDFQVFHDWAFANGYEENAKYGKCTLDRIDVNGNYCPSNCRWVDMKAQASNRRKNKKKGG